MNHTFLLTYGMVNSTYNLFDGSADLKCFLTDNYYDDVVDIIHVEGVQDFDFVVRKEKKGAELTIYESPTADKYFIILMTPVPSALLDF